MSFARLNFAFLNSTQIWVLDHLDCVPRNDWLLVTADQQDAGVATQGRSWYSPLGNLYLTLATRIVDFKKLSYKTQIAQVTSLAVAKTLEHFGFNPQLKWVNDVVLYEKKVSGVLAEIATHNQEKYLVIGVGINVNLRYITASELIPLITSLWIEKGCEFNLEKILQVFLDLFFPLISNYFAQENAKNLTCQIQQRLNIQPGEMVAVFTGDKKIAGIFLGLDEQGQVQLQTQEKIMIIHQGSMVKIKN